MTLPEKSGRYMRIIRNMIVAFSLYSRIPMPMFTWEKEDMKYNLVFLPFIGAVIGVLEYLCFWLFDGRDLPVLFRIAVMSIIPILITGGFHIDGFMDTQDAINSYKPREEKLEILKDPHIGAFAVISLLAYSIFWAGAMALFQEKISKEVVIVLAVIFVIARVISGITAITFRKAKKDGMLNSEAKDSDIGCVVALAIELLISIVVMAMANLWLTLVVIVAEALFVAYYRFKTYKEFGGVTGDTAGYLVTVSELIMLMALVLGIYVI